MTVIELRQYTMRPGQRDVLVELFDRYLIAGQEALGMRILGVFHDLDDPDRFVWLREFPDMARRKEALTKFYLEGEVWREHGPAARVTMIDSDDVLLLRPVGDFTVPKAERLVVTIQDSKPEVPAYLETEPAENDFPRLPVRTDVPKFVWFTDDERHGGSLRLAAVPHPAP
jgi:hypothetical protein